MSNEQTGNPLLRAYDAERKRVDDGEQSSSPQENSERYLDRFLMWCIGILFGFAMYGAICVGLGYWSVS